MKHRPRWNSYYASDADPAEPKVEPTDPKITKLLGPKGETLRTFSDRPPIGFGRGQS